MSVGRNKSTLNFEDEVVPVSQNRIENAIIKQGTEGDTETFLFSFPKSLVNLLGLESRISSIFLV